MGLSPELEEDFRQFVESRWTHLVRSAYLMTGDDGKAEDLVQTTLAKVYPHWGRLHGAGGQSAYVRKALMNQAISTSRRKRVTDTLFGGSSREDRPGLPEGFDADRSDAYRTIDQRDSLLRLLRELPPQMRAVVVLRYFDDLTEAATAEALGISIGSVKSQTSRGLDRLRAALTSVNEGSAS